MTAPVWIPMDVIIAIHEEQIAEHGGLAGLRDLVLLDSALARPQNAFAYGEKDLCLLAALYAAGLVRNHPFADGNKLTAFVSCELFLAANGLLLEADDDACIVKTVALAAGDIDEHDYAVWLRANVEGG
jgi:death-on-curing protein